MAQIRNNSKGFLIIEVSATECVDVFGGMGICDSCNSFDLNGYYIAVLNCWYCPSCYQEWLLRARRYEEDIRIEQRNFDYYCKLLAL